jgi:hypothetical protein
MALSHRNSGPRSGRARAVPKIDQAATVLDEGGTAAAVTGGGD